MIRALIRTGLAILTLSILGLIISDTEMGGDHRLFLRKALAAGAALFVSGILLAFLGRVGDLRLGRRCPRCRHPVRDGHVYCEDHFQESIFRGRDQLASR